MRTIGWKLLFFLWIRSRFCTRWGSVSTRFSTPWKMIPRVTGADYTSNITNRGLQTLWRFWIWLKIQSANILWFLAIWWLVGGYATDPITNECRTIWMWKYAISCLVTRSITLLGLESDGNMYMPWLKFSVTFPDKIWPQPFWQISNKVIFINLWSSTSAYLIDE